MKIVDVICSKSYTGFYFDDQQAIKAGAKLDGFVYTGPTKTAGFSSIRQAGEAISVQLVLEDNTVAYCDCAAVQYSGTGGRDPLFLSEVFIEFIDTKLKSHLIGMDVSTFKSNIEYIDHLVVDGKKLHTALRYGITGAIMDASAKVNKCSIAELIRKEYGIIGDDYNYIPVFSQSGDDRYTNVDKMIIKQSDVLPHALINHVETKLGYDGEILLEYLTWLASRITEIKTDASYMPVIHIDVYGTIGIAFNGDIDKMAKYISTLVDAVKPYKLRVEGPMDTGERESQIQQLAALTAKIDELGIDCELVADEWCNTYEDIVDFIDAKAGHMLQVKTPDLGGMNNTIEALIACKNAGVGAYCGGTCNETNKTAELTTNIAIATRADQCLAKPGMGMDEGYMIVKNEMNRVIALTNKK